MRTIQMTLDDDLVKAVVTVFQRNSTQIVLHSQERHCKTRLFVTNKNSWKSNTVGGTNKIRLSPMSFRFGNPSRIGVTNETWRNTLV